MNSTSFFTSGRKLYAAFALMILCLLMAAYGPMASYSEAQAVQDATLQQMKQKASDELNRRINNFKKTLTGMDVSAKFGDGGAGANSSASGSIHCISDDTSDSKSSSTPSAGMSLTLQNKVLTGLILLPCGFKDEVKQYVQKSVDELTTLLQRVQGATSLSDMQGLAKNIDTQFDLNQLTEVQGTVTQAVDSSAGLLSSLQTTYNNIQSRITQMQTECLQGSGAVGACADASTNTQGELDDAASVGTVGGAQSQMGVLQTIIQTMSSILSSALVLLSSLFSSFTGLLGGLGGGGGLGNLGSLGSLGGSSGGLTSLLGSAGGMSGMLTSFTSISSELGSFTSMGSNAQGLLGGLGSLLKF